MSEPMDKTTPADKPKKRNNAIVSKGISGPKYSVPSVQDPLLASYLREVTKYPRS